MRGRGRRLDFYHTFTHHTHTANTLGFLGGCRSGRSYGSHIVYAKVSNGVKKCTLFGRDKQYVLLHLYSLTQLLIHPLTKFTLSHSLNSPTHSAHSLTQLTHSPTQSLLARIQARTHPTFMIIDCHLWSFVISFCLWSVVVKNDLCWSLVIIDDR